MNNNADDIPQSERRRILAEDRRGKTYQGRAIAELSDVGGRFSAVTKQSVTGSTPAQQYPRQPATSPFSGDPVGPEPLIDGRGEGDRLGYAIDDMGSLASTSDAEDSGGAIAEGRSATANKGE